MTTGMRFQGGVHLDLSNINFLMPTDEIKVLCIWDNNFLFIFVYIYISQSPNKSQGENLTQLVASYKKGHSHSGADELGQSEHVQIAAK